MTMVDFQHQSTQTAVDKQYYTIWMDEWNHRWFIRLKAIQVEYYYIDELKSYSDTM